MIGRILTRIIIRLLNNTHLLSVNDMSLLTASVLRHMGALPLHDIIKVDEQGTLFVNGRSLNYDEAAKLRASAKAALSNYATQFVDDQVLFAAITLGVHKLERPEQSFFSRAAIWWGQQRHELLKKLAGDTERELLP